VDLNKDFGYVVWLDMLSNGNVEKETEILNLPLFQVYRKIQFIGHKSRCENNYQKLISKKPRRG
jgi:hypothetical protein